MVRFILAFLAMLSGIAALGQPVAARTSAAEAQAVQRANCVVVAQEAEADGAVSPVNTLPGLLDGNSLEKPSQALAFSRTVHIRCDRALE